MSSAAFDWNQFKKEEGQPSPQPIQNQGGFEWNRFQKEESIPEPPKQQSFLQGLAQKAGGVANTLIGNQVRPLSRALEVGISLPRELGELGELFVPEQAILKGAEKVGLKEGAQNLLDFTKKYAPYKLFPTSDEAKKFTTELFGKYSKPRNSLEAIADEVVTDASSLALPAGGELKALRPVLTSLGAQLAKQGVRWFGGSESAQNLAKLGTVGISAFVRPKESKELGNSLFKAARRSRPADATVSSVPLESAVNTLDRDFRVGGIAASDKPALEKIADIKKEIQGAQIPIEALERLKVKINEARTGLYNAVELQGNKPGIKSAKRNLDMVSKTVDDALKLYGKQNPTWESFYRPANEVHGAIAQSQKARRWMIKNYKTLSLPSAAALFGVKAALGPLGTAATALGGTAAVIGAEALAKVSKSPTLRKYFTQVISASLAEDLPKFQAASKKLNTALDKENQVPAQ